MTYYIALGQYQDDATILCISKNKQKVIDYLYNNFKYVEKYDEYSYYCENERYIDCYSVLIKKVKEID